jgi:RNA polymerase sigma-70 factor (ECF subfamily)
MLGELKRAAERLAGRGRADDLVQETLLRALVAWDRFRPGANPRPWLYTILRNTFISERRRAVRETELAVEPADHDRSGERVLSLDLTRALGELSEPLRQTLLAVDAEGMAYREAAEHTGAPIGTVMSRLHRARRRMALRLAAA